MKYPLKDIAKNISGIWVNEQYDLLLGLPPHATFSFADNTGEGLNGEYFIVQPSDNHYPILRLIDSTGMSHDYVINELIVFDTLIISNEGEIIHFKNVPPDEYEQQ